MEKNITTHLLGIISELKSDISQGTLHTKVWGYSTCIKFASDKVPISTMLFQGHLKYFYWLGYITLCGATSSRSVLIGALSLAMKTSSIGFCYFSHHHIVLNALIKFLSKIFFHAFWNSSWWSLHTNVQNTKFVTFCETNQNPSKHSNTVQVYPLERWRSNVHISRYFLHTIHIL